MPVSRWFMLGALYALISVLAGSFGAHALKATLQAQQTLEVFQIARDYLGFHGLGLMLLALAIEKWPAAGLARPARLLAIGALLFSASLWLYALTGQRTFAHIAPLGGGLLIGGWLWLTVLAFRHAR